MKDGNRTDVTWAMHVVHIYIYIYIYISRHNSPFNTLKVSRYGPQPFSRQLVPENNRRGGERMLESFIARL